MTTEHQQAGPAAAASARRFPILAREDYSDASFMLEIGDQPLARAARAGQFVIVMLTENGERIPLTLADFDPAQGTFRLVIQAVGKTTRQMQAQCHPGTTLYSVAGPMGEPSRIGHARKLICVGGGLGVAPIFPQARAHQRAGTRVFGVLGFRSAARVFWEDRFRAVCEELVLCTDDGSAGIQGLVTLGMDQVLARHPDCDAVIAIGPPVMMRACAEFTRPRGIATTVSLNPIMVDGTGMCGGCRVRVDERIQFACVDGPDFDGHKVDFDDLMNRQRRFRTQEAQALQKWSDSCRLHG